MKLTKKLAKPALLVAALSVVGCALADDSRSESQKTLDRNMADAKRTKDMMEKERVREELRDKNHDNRLMTGKDTSVGVDPSTRGINIRHTTP